MFGFRLLVALGGFQQGGSSLFSGMARNRNHRIVDNPGVDITSVIEIYWVGERRWTPVCLDTQVLSITYFEGGGTGFAEVLWQGNRRDGGRRERVWWRMYPTNGL